MNGYLPPLGALRAFEATARLKSFSKATENEPISTACTLTSIIKPKQA